MSHARRPSLSNWLSRSSTSTKSPPSKLSHNQVRISEPKFMRSLESLNHVRGGSLGSGAQIVRTPQDALLGSDVFTVSSAEEEATTSYFPHERTGTPSCIPEQQEEEQSSQPSSPGLQHLPFAHMGSTSSPDILNSVPLRSLSPPRPTRAPPAPPRNHKSTHAAPLRLGSPISEEFPDVPPLPAAITISPPQSAFQAIVVSGNPTSAVDPTKIIVSIETETQTFKTTINTLTSRPSHLASFVLSLLPKTESAAEDASIYSEDQSMYHRFLATEGMLSKASFNLHIFLDRPSTSYSHILNYLRCPSLSPHGPDSLPRTMKLQTCVPSRLDALLDLRDEASYLGLEELFRLCTDELRQRLASQSNQNSRRNTSHSSLRSLGLLNHPVHKPSAESVLHGERDNERRSVPQGQEEQTAPPMERHSNTDASGRVLMTPLSMHRLSDDSEERAGSASQRSMSAKSSQPNQPLTGRWI